jgi:beta-phosphoglucomutase-like phosphatase (HAD superfamily)
MEDAVAGVEAALRAGMRCIAVASTNPPEAMQLADLVVQSWDLLSEAGFLGIFGVTHRRL